MKVSKFRFIVLRHVRVCIIYVCYPVNMLRSINAHKRVWSFSISWTLSDLVDGSLWPAAVADLPLSHHTLRTSPAVPLQAFLPCWISLTLGLNISPLQPSIVLVLTFVA